MLVASNTNIDINHRVLVLVPGLTIAIHEVQSNHRQIHSEFKAFVREQVRHKLIDFEGEAKNSRIGAVLRWWSKCISMAIAKTASRNVAFKVARMRESIMEDQDEFIIRDSGREEVGSEANNRAALEDSIGYNADLYIANQECNTQN